MKQMRVGESGQISLSFVPDALSHPVVQDSLRAFRRTHQNIDLNVRQSVSRSALTGVRAGQLDLAYVYRSHLTQAGEFASMEVGALQWLFVFPADHVLARKEDLRLSDFRGGNFIWYARDQSPETFDEFSPICDAAGLHLKDFNERGDIFTSFKLVAAGMGVTVTASSVADQYISPNIVFRRLPEFDAPFFIDLLWSRHNQSAALKSFCATMRRHVPAVAGTKQATPVVSIDRAPGNHSRRKLVSPSKKM
jgi:DNA-binding transcriptional LysR family regulator